MHLIEILIPVVRGRELRKHVAWLTETLTEKFGGMTAFVRSPGEGLWENGSETVRDDIVVLEVMASGLDRNWWGSMRQQLEDRLGQEEIVIRAVHMERL